MSLSDWQLRQHAAQFHRAPLRAQIDLTHPAAGLRHLHVGSQEIPGAMLLGIALPWTFPSIAPSDAYVRGGDLLASYRSGSAAVQVDVLWHAVEVPAQDAATVAFELIVSARTEQLESEPAVAVESSLPCEQALRLTPSGQFSALPTSDTSPLVLRPDEAVSCVLCRLPGSELSYVEMVHRADCHETRLEGSAGTLKIRHRLFAETLEKGVILRARVRGALVPRGEDVRLAAAWHAAFAGTEPPLGT
jgi:hypothetical protein